MDSLRIFPVSLQSFCKLFSVEGKLTPYNPKWNKPTILEDKYEMKELVKYAGQDSAALYKALKEAQLTYIDKYGVDITSVVSLPALAMKILRLNFLKSPIPILTGFNDYFVRKSYFGGAVDIYKAHGVKCYYYDVRSLYPYAMTKPMPLELIETLTGSALDSFDLNSFFGFIELEIHCPATVKRPVLPLRWQNRTIYPRGKFSGVYFSEEVKDMVSLGYKIVKVKCAKRFTKGYIFNDYVKEMFEIKNNSVGAERWIAKLLLNSLYGVFGRRQEQLKTITIPSDMEAAYLTAFPSATILNINDDLSTILFDDKPNYQALDQMKAVFHDKSPFKRSVKANVAIASAITSYSRIHMNRIKQLPYVIYTDTDSAITTQPLPEHLIGN
uniref:DNA-directed DNA polymerase n=1 Tax=Ganoderma tsugae TaxID=2075311 RepID=A0A2S1WBA0_GANTS|nr:DNA polymerase [Ganoderma tsugae]AWJ63880.1 DNA polymerase [Ganoderma tsugae]